MLKYFLELRNKIALIIITFFSTFLICYLYKDVLLFLVTQIHLSNENFYFIFTDVTELFYTYFKLIFFFSIQITLWYSIYHIFFFLSTALYIQEFSFLSFLFKSSTFFWAFSSLLSNYVLIPFGWSFFLNFQSQQGFYFEARISEYFEFYSNLYILCLVYSQSFILLFFFLNDIQESGPYVKKYRKLYYYAFLLLSTILTPPDLVSQICTTVFMVVVYEIILLFLIIKFWINRFNLVTS